MSTPKVKKSSGGTTTVDNDDAASNDGSIITSSSSKSTPSLSYLVKPICSVLLLQALYLILNEAFEIRLYAIKEFGRIIHEFDPYFNYRATEYLYEHGWYKFRTWFDYMVWYPLGRPVGTTIYPGMQVTSVFIKNHILINWSINDICCFVPAWFGTIATLSVGFFAFMCTYNDNTFTSILIDIPGVAQLYQYIILPIITILLNFMNTYIGTTFGLRNVKSNTNNWFTAFCCGVGSSAIMSILPAHLLRSIGGGYDNESIAMTAMVMTFATWCMTLRKRDNEYVTILFGIITGLAYFYMVAAWGGYVFVLNVVGVHASALVAIGRYSTQLHRAYTSFFLVGTITATFIPVVGYTPLKSLEQLGPLLAFGGMQLIELCEVMIRQKRLNDSRKKKFTRMDAWKLRITVFGTVGAIGALACYGLMLQGYFGPISSRVRGLFVKHTKTGNPLVDSVAEHQAASPQAYMQYLQNVIYIAPIGYVITALFYWNDASSFLIVYGIAAYYFSHRMVRLILLTAPIASVLGGIFIGRVAAWGVSGVIELFDLLPILYDRMTKGSESSSSNNTDDEPKGKSSKKGGSSKKDTSSSKAVKSVVHPIIPIITVLIRCGGIWYLINWSKPYCKSFYSTGHEMAKAISHPTIITKARTQQGQEVILDDYREAYFWLRDHTPPDARIMAWWDYGYQITGIGNRTTIADGNTWNHEHIALLGRTLTAPEKEAHRIARHLADYVLVWAGGGGDDVAKSPHLRRIANSVYRGLCPEPTCRDFGFYGDRSPTESMRVSLLYTLHSHGMNGVQADPNRFREVFASKYGKVRIFKIQSVSKESKDWVEDPKNRLCDAPGSWFCPGQYPPPLKKILASKKDFQQLEDFNKGNTGGDDEYTKQYLGNLLGEKQGLGDRPKDASGNIPKPVKLTPEEIDTINEHWENNDITSKLWESISGNHYDVLKTALKQQPQIAHLRSQDGRGPMWWAHESGNKRIVDLLKKYKVSETRTDSNGISPLEISKIKK